MHAVDLRIGPYGAHFDGFAPKRSHHPAQNAHFDGLAFAKDVGT